LLIIVVPPPPGMVKPPELDKVKMAPLLEPLGAAAGGPAAGTGTGTLTGSAAMLGTIGLPPEMAGMAGVALLPADGLLTLMGVAWPEAMRTFA
jgi:hypothetical protein